MELGVALDRAAAELAVAGVPSPRADAELLAAHLLHVSRPEIVRRALLGGTDVPGGYDELVAERARRVPLQHLTGRAPFRDLDLAVGPGVFVPRPETEEVAGIAIDAARAAVASTGRALVVDLCTGSGAIALAVATEVPKATVVAVEVSVDARAWAQANIAALAPGRVDLRAADVTTPAALRVLADLLGQVDVVAGNPPYIPPGQEPVDPEVRDHDPPVALYGLGPDGLTVPRGFILLAARLLRPGGRMVMEHADVQGAASVAAVAAGGGWYDVEDHLDLSGRPRYVTATRAGAAPA
ncbi:MAG: peptide chain release factor N(5)-glutamine methyltransferase [Actinomycetales bacterium]